MRIPSDSNGLEELCLTRTVSSASDWPTHKAQLLFWPNNFLTEISAAFINLHFWVHSLLFSSHPTKGGLLKKQLGAYTKQFAGSLTPSAS